MDIETIPIYTTQIHQGLVVINMEGTFLQRLLTTFADGTLNGRLEKIALDEMLFGTNSESILEDGRGMEGIPKWKLSNVDSL